MKQGTIDLFQSERGVFCVAIVLLSALLVVLGKLVGADWISLMKWTAVTLVISKTATGALDTMTGKTDTAPPVSAP